MANVVLDRISKQFGAVHAVRDGSLNIDDGELQVLTGPSGSGKSTTLRKIAGLEAVNDGRNLFDG